VVVGRKNKPAFKNMWGKNVHQQESSKVLGLEAHHVLTRRHLGGKRGKAEVEGF